MLVSRDEQSCLVVSYREIKACIESAFGYVTCLNSFRLCTDVADSVKGADHDDSGTVISGAGPYNEHLQDTNS